MKSMRPGPRAALVALALAAAAAGCKKPVATGADAGTDGGAVVPEKGAFLSACQTDADCTDGLCLPSHVCSKSCAAAKDCPSAGGWGCDPVNGRSMCDCVPASETEACDGRDDNCNGVADEGATCPGLEVCEAGACTCPAANSCGTDCVDLKTSVLHCGSCDDACSENETCGEDDGGTTTCLCPGKSCGGACVETDFDDANCGDCGAPCGAGTECVGAVCQPIDRDWTAWTPATQLSFAPAGDGVRDQDTGLVWSRASDAPMSLDDARGYCAGLVTDLDADAGTGTTGWRLPTRAELLSIVDYARAMPALDPDGFPDGYAGAVWTATPALALPDDSGDGSGDAGVGAPTSYWVVDFTDGSTRAQAVGGADGTLPIKLLARCVR